MRSRSPFTKRALYAAAAVLPALGSVAEAQTITTNSNLHLTPLGIYDSGPLLAPPVYGASGVTLSRLEFDSPTSSILPPAASSSSITTFNAAMTLNLPSLGTGLHPTANALANIFANSRSGGGGDFNTEMLSMNISGLPAGALIRESPTRASTGHTFVNDIGGGQFQISSFFDVFTELSLDGAQTWIPSSSSAHVVLTGTTPEPSSIALAALAGAMTLRRRRRFET